MITALNFIGDLRVQGAQTVVMNYLRYLNNDPDVKIIVSLLGNPTNSPYEEECKRIGVEIHYLHFRRNSFPLIHSLINWVKMQYLYYREIRIVNPDIVHTHVSSLLQIAMIPIVLSGVRTRIHTLHSDPYFFTVWKVMWTRLAIHVAGFYPVCVTESQAQRAVKRYKIKKYSIIKNGVDASRFGHANKAEVRRELEIGEDIFVIGCVGRFSKVKNHEFLIRIFAEFIKQTPNALLMLVGEGELRANIESLAKELGILDKLLFTGLRSDVERMYYAMDLFMLTSHFESSSIVTVEAQFAGVRCVISSSIPENVVVTPRVNRISLDAPTETWLAAMRGELKPDATRGTLDDFSMENASRDLKLLYLKLTKNEKNSLSHN